MHARRTIIQIIDYRWIGVLVHDYEATYKFFEYPLSLELAWRDRKDQVAMYRFPSGQEFEVYAPANRTRDPRYCFYDGPVIGLTVNDLENARDREELATKGARFVDAIES